MGMDSPDRKISAPVGLLNTSFRGSETTEESLHFTVNQLTGRKDVVRYYERIIIATSLGIDRN